MIIRHFMLIDISVITISVWIWIWIFIIGRFIGRVAEWSKALDLGSSLRAWVQIPPRSFCVISLVQLFLFARFKLLTRFYYFQVLIHIIL